MQNQVGILGREQRLEQILETMGPVIRHDFPNLMVVLQGLLQLLEQEESPRLSESGRDYVFRLRRVTHRTLELARFLREMTRFAWFEDPHLELTLPRLGRDLESETQRLFTRCKIHWQHRWSVERIVAGYHGTLLGLVELVRNATMVYSGPVCQAVVESVRRETGTEVTLSFPEIVLAANKSTEEPIEWTLARNFLAFSGGTLQVPVENEMVFVIHFPHSTTNHA